MKTLIILLSILFCNYFIGFTQVDQKRISTQYGDTLNLIISKGNQYLYEDFTQGTVFFNTNERSRAYMNYNILLNEIHFIEHNVLLEANIESESDFFNYIQAVDLNGVNFITIGQDVFQNTTKGIMLLIANYGGLRLLQKNSIRLVSQSTVGAYGQRSQTAAIETHRSLSHNYQVLANLTPQVISDYEQRSEFYLLKDNRLMVASQKRFERNFRSIRNELREFVSENKINFNNPLDLRSLLVFAVDNSL